MHSGAIDSRESFAKDFPSGTQEGRELPPSGGPAPRAMVSGAPGYGIRRGAEREGPERRLPTERNRPLSDHFVSEDSLSISVRASCSLARAVRPSRCRAASRRVFCFPRLSLIVTGSAARQHRIAAPLAKTWGALGGRPHREELLAPGEGCRLGLGSDPNHGTILFEREVAPPGRRRDFFGKRPLHTCLPSLGPLPKRGWPARRLRSHSCTG